MTKRLAPMFKPGSQERIALAQTIARLVGSIARLAMVARLDGGQTVYEPAIGFPSLSLPSDCDMTSVGVVLETYDHCFSPDSTWQQVRGLRTPFGYWRICPGVHNGGGDVSISPSSLERLLKECQATPLLRGSSTPTGYPEVKLYAVRRIGNTSLPEPQLIEDRVHFPGYKPMAKSWHEEWNNQIAPNLPAWYTAA